MKEYKGYKYGEYNGKWAIFTDEEKPWVVEIETEEKCKKWIDETIDAEEHAVSIDEQIKEIEEALCELAELIVGGNE